MTGRPSFASRLWNLAWGWWHELRAIHHQRRLRTHNERLDGQDEPIEHPEQ